MFFKFSYKSVKAGLPASFWRIFTGLQGFNELFYRNVTGLFHRLYRVFTGFCTIFKGFYRFYQTQAFATAGMRILGMKTHSTIVDQNYKFKISETRQNEAFWVEAHSILNYGWRKFKIQELWNAPEWRILGRSTLKILHQGWRKFQI